MGSCSIFVLAILTVVAFFLVPSWAEIRHISIEGDSRSVIEFEKFGFSHEGRLDITVTNISYSSDKVTPSSMGFFLITEENWVQVLVEYSRSDAAEAPCVLNNPQTKPLFKLLFNFEKIVDESYKKSFSPPDADEYKLMFANCMPNVKVWMNMRTAMYNLLKDGKRDYLSVGQTALPKLYFSMFFVYLVLTAGWCYLCWKKKGTVHMIHGLMGVLLVMKALNLLCEAEDKSYTKRTGTAHGWDIAFYGFSFVKGVMLFTVIVLIGTGWSILKPFLQEKEKRVLMIVIPLQVFANIAAVVIDESGPDRKDWITWTQLLLLLDVICCCAVLFPIIWSIKHLRQAAQTDGKAARSLMKLTLFRQYYIVLVSYIYFTRIVVFAVRTIISYQYSWSCDLTTELATMAFYIFTGYKFRPESHNPYFRLDDDEEEAAAEEALEDDDFEL
uniref:Protein GPR107 n=1 Tax=Araucaria cunninghamii TaxID=56994 RepID=A0A0D6QXB8_ARACU